MDVEQRKAVIEAQLLMGHCVPSPSTDFDRVTILDYSWDVDQVRPTVWKRALGLGKDKEASRLKAMQLFPSADLRRKKDQGRAEALLLAVYGFRGSTEV